VRAKMKKIGFIALIFGLLIGCASNTQSPVSSPNVDDFAPDFNLVDVSGNEFRLSDFKGEKNVALIFYAKYD
jgi:cytochrome oxidase Cu insertion factor (SCO1/SenC/PrrC family)